jgi:hypothetical protein
MRLYYIIRNNGEGWHLANCGDTPTDTTWTSEPLLAKTYDEYEAKDFIAISEYACALCPAADHAIKGEDYIHMANLLRSKQSKPTEIKPVESEPVFIKTTQHFKDIERKDSVVIYDRQFDHSVISDRERRI